MNWQPLDTWIVIIAALCALSCALLGNFLVLRKMSMMGDAISHAVLPGIAIAFLRTDSRASLPMFIGAAAAGVITAVFTQWIRSFGKVDHGAAMGVVFTTLFAIGLILLSGDAAKQVDLDPKCVLYGAIETAPLDTVPISVAGVNVAVPRAAIVLAAVLAVNALVVTLLYKEFKITSFDPALATTLGINANLMHYLLMTLVAITTVACFEAIGSILVIAMLIVPAAAAHLLTDRMGRMIGISLVFGAGSAALGHIAAITVPQAFGFRDTTTAGSIATMAGILFFITALFAPRHGVLTKWRNRRTLSRRITREDVLGLLYRIEERAGVVGVTPMTEIANSLMLADGTARAAVSRLLRDRRVAVADTGVTLTDAGRAEARELIRAHRLWETYLERNLPLPVDHLHAPAENLEHITDADLRNRLAEETAHPTMDPQGKQVPQ